MKPSSIFVCAFCVAIAASCKADTPWGNPFQTGMPPTSILVEPGAANWTRFTAPEAFEFHSAQIRIAGTTAATVNISLQGDNGEGFPSGTPLARGVLTSPGEGWNRVAFDQPARLESGEVYFLVAEAVEGHIDWMCINAKAGVQPSGQPDKQWAHGSNRKLFPRTTAMYFLERSGGVPFGQPYLSKYNYRVIGRKQIPAQRFVFRPHAEGESRLMSATVLLNVMESTDRDYTLALLTDQGDVVEVARLPGADLSPGKPQNYTFDFSGETSLTPEHTYILALYCDDERATTVWVSNTTDKDVSEAERATWQGTEGYAVVLQDDTFRSRQEPDLYRDLIFTLGLRAR